MENAELPTTSTPSTEMDIITSTPNDLGSATGQTELQAAETDEQNLKQRASFIAPLYRSSASFAESYSCPLSHHQYHYIQYPYPAGYYEHINQQTKLSPHATTNTCHCRCSCGGSSPQAHEPASAQTQQQQQSQLHRIPCHSHQSSADSQMSVAVIVHRQAGGSGSTSVGAGAGSQESTKAHSEQSLLNHSYQALVEDKPLNNVGNSKLNISCDCDLECTCAAFAARRAHKGLADDIMLAADEITVSESDNNSTMVKRKKASHINKKPKGSWCTHESFVLQGKNGDSNYNSSQIDIYSDGDGDGDGDGNGLNACLKDSNETELVDGNDHRPPLPPRLPPRPRNITINSNSGRHHGTGGIKKYVVWCLLCGGFSCLLGVLFLGVYFLLHSYTITVGNFETVPTFVPATLLILTGLCIMSLARRKNRYSYLIKLSGACGLISALTCALVTVTTTVLHMSRLQALRECEYAQKTRTCTCYSEDVIESQMDHVDKEGVRLVFDSLSDCGVVHGSLYSCLRAIFGLSVAGVLIAVFSCMLVYQLLSHERKKMYWEQLELRCRSLYTSQQGPPPNVTAMGAMARGTGICRCCEQCHAHRQAPVVYPWVADDGSGEPRFWTGQPPGNFYSPNPGSEDPHFGTMANCRGGGATNHNAPNTRNRASSGWSWPRMPWQRNSPDTNSRFRQTPSSPDSQYGFSNAAQSAVAESMNVLVGEESSTAVTHNMQPFNIIATGGYGVWGPPPPYSDPNSPARYYQYIQSNACNAGNNNVTTSSHSDGPILNVSHASEQHMGQCISHHRSAFVDLQPADATSCTTQQTSSGRSSAKRQLASALKLKSNGSGYENTPSDSDCGGIRDRSSNTLPTRKMRKRVEAGAGVKSIGPNSHSTQRINVQQVFVNTPVCDAENNTLVVAQHSESQLNTHIADNESNSAHVETPCVQTQRHKRGVENSGFQNSTECGNGIADGNDACDPSESEVYFADVSSCCNMSVKNDNYYEDADQSNHMQQQHGLHTHLVPHHHHQSSNCSHSSSCQEDYLCQRFGQRENSIRSRLPFPQISQSEDYEAKHKLNATPAPSKSEVATIFSCNHMQKEVSRQSMCSVDSEAKTEFTDLSPSTPSSNKCTQLNVANPAAVNATAGNSKPANAPPPLNFVPSFPPYSSESQCLEARRRTTKNISDMMLNAPTEAHYEVIKDSNTALSSSPQFPVSASNMRNISNKPTPQRPNNLIGSKRHELTPLKSKPKYMSRECLDSASAISQPDMNTVVWQEIGGGNDRMRL